MGVLRTSAFLVDCWTLPNLTKRMMSGIFLWPHGQDAESLRLCDRLKALKWTVGGRPAATRTGGPNMVEMSRN